MNILELDSYSLADAVKFNDQLNPRIWQGQTMRPQVRAKLLEIAADFQQFLGVPDLDVRDITVSGSNAGYTYTDHSDIDLHLVVAMPEQCDEVYQELFNAKKYQYNDEHDIRIGGYDVELYVQPADQPHVSAGVYSVMNNDWIHIPRKLRADVDDAGVKNKYEDVKARVEAAVKSSDIDRMQKLWDKIKDMRRAGLAANGELGPENLAFKILRTQGVIGGLKDAIARERDRELSLTERRKKKKKVRYGFGGYWYPGFAFGTGSDAGSDGGGGGDGGGEARIQEVGLSPDGVSPETKMFLSEKPAPTHEEIIRDFFKHAVEQLGIENIPGLKLKKDPQWSIRNQSFGRYDNATGNIDLAVGNRHIMDVLRTLAHELMHRKQDERDQLPPGAGETGSPYENEAHVIAGILMRHYADLHPEYFEDVPVSESASGYIPTRKQARDPRYAMALTGDIKPGEVGRQANKMALKTDSQGRPGLLMKTANLREGRAYDGNDPPGPETPPTMPQGTVRVDVSDVYDWYKLGQHIANLKGLGHHDFGAGPPSTIVSFGDEDTEHKFIKNLQATGLDVTDIDPRDPKQPPGMRKIKTDPTYNVDESAGNPLVDLTPNYPNYRKLIGEFIGINKNQRALFKIIDIELIPGQGPTEKIEQAKLTGRPISIEMQRIRNRKVVDQGMAEGQVYDFQPSQLIDVFYDPSTVTNQVEPVKVATIPYRNLDRLTALLKQKHGIDATKLRWSAAKPNNPQDVTEAFDQPYPLKWSKSEHGDYDALARLSDGSPLSISFEHVTPYEVAVSFTRGHSLDVTGAGDAQRVFATVLAAIQQFLKKEQPANISFSASKEGEEGESTESRAKLYNRLVDRYATQWGYSVRVFDQGSQVEYELYRGFEPPFESQGVARSLNEFAPGGDEGNSPYAYAIALKEMARLYAEGAFDYDLAPGSKAQNESDAEDISQVADAFMNQGMEAGREAYNMVDTGVRDEMDSYLKDQGFNVQNDIHAEYQKDVERYRNSPQGRAQAQAQAAKDAEYAKGAAARKANEVVISAMDATTGEEEFSKISFDRGSFSPEQLRAKIQRSVAELKQHFVDYPGRNPSEKIIKVTIGGKPVDIDQGVAEAVHPDVTSKKYFLDPTQNVKMGDFVFNARTFTGGLADPNARGLQIRAYDPKNITSSIGSADFVVKSDPKGRQWLESDDTEVDELYRGQGVAAMMYAFAKSLGNDIKDSAYKSKAGSDMWAKWGPDAKNLAKEQDDLVESLRREFELLENEVLGEIKMSPKNLRAEAAKTGAVAGMEFEMIVPNVSGLDDYRESEPDWDMDESVRDIDDACNFFYDGDFNSRRDIEGLREGMTEQYYDWLDERKKERWEEESSDYIRDWLWRTYEDDWREEAQKEIVDQAPEFGVNDEELRQRVEDFVNEKWEAATEDVLANMGYDWDQAYDEWSEDFNANADMEDEWLSDQGWTTMRDIYQNFDIQWPHYTTPESDGADVNAVADDFSDAVGMPVNASTSYHGGRREPGHYVVEPDSSLEPNDSDDQGLEFVSPPMPIDELLDQLKKVRKWAGRYGCYTNESTGLHINISVPDYDLAKLDYVKLALLMGDEYVLDQFGRSSNTYTKSAMGKIRDILRQRPEAAEQVLDRMKGHMADLATKAIHSGSTDKYTSINTKNGYIEFRSPGGDWLDANFDKVENTLLRFTVALSAAMDPQAYRQEYLKKLYKLLSPKNEDDPISYFAKYSAGELPKAALRSFVKQVQLQRRIKRDPTGGQKYWWTVGRPGYDVTVQVVASSKEEAIALGKKEFPEWDYAKDMTAKPLRPYDDSPVKATLGEPQPIGQSSSATLNGRPSNPDGNYVITPEDDRNSVYYRFMAASFDDANVVRRQWVQQNPNRVWVVQRDDNRTLGQPPVPGSTLDLQRRRAAAATSDIINPLYQNVPIPGVIDVELDIPMAEPRPLGVGREFAGWKVLLPSGEEVYRFSGVGNSQSDANRIAADWLRNNGMGVSGEGFEVVPVWREA